MMSQGLNKSAVIIGNDVWIGSKLYDFLTPF
jgi:hypothetical protein